MDKKESKKLTIIFFESRIIADFIVDSVIAYTFFVAN